MLLFGDTRTIPEPDMGFRVVGLYTLKEGINRLNLAPSFEISSVDEYQFDMTYANFIISDNNMFLELMGLIFPLYDGENVYCVIDRNEYFEQLTESLGKFIQQRYGYNHAVINEYDDYYYLSGVSFTFSIQGLFNFDMDKKRYTELMLKMHPDMVFQEGVDESGNRVKFIPEGFLYNKRF